MTRREVVLRHPGQRVSPPLRHAVSWYGRAGVFPNTLVAGLVVNALVHDRVQGVDHEFPRLRRQDRFDHPGDHEIVVLGGGAGLAGQCPHHAVAQLATGECRGDSRQVLQGPGDPHFLARRAEPDAASPLQPVGAGAHAGVTPAALGIEAGQHLKEPIIRGVDLARE